MALAKRQVNPSRSSIALSRMAPPSELACGWSNFAMIGLEIPWTWRALCAIQAVAIEPPRFCAMSRLVNALFAHFRGSMALFFHLSRIIRASPHMCRLRLCGFCAAPRRTSGTTTTLAPLTSRYYTRCDAFGAGGRRFKSSHPDHSFDSGVCFLPPEPCVIRGSDESSGRDRDADGAGARGAGAGVQLSGGHQAGRGPHQEGRGDEGERGEQAAHRGGQEARRPGQG